MSTLLESLNDNQFWLFSRHFLGQAVFESRQIAQTHLVKKYTSERLEKMIPLFIPNATRLNALAIQKQIFEDENKGCHCCKEFEESTEKCPECDQPTVNGDSQKGCHYSPISCQKCGYAPCDGSC